MPTMPEAKPKPVFEDKATLKLKAAG